MTKTRPYLDGGKEVIGYMLNSGFSAENIAKIQDIQQFLESKFPGSLVFYPGESLHITLMDWIAPLVDYGRDKDEMFNELYPKYDKVLTNILKDIKPITVHFKENGSYQKIRDEFTSQIELVEGTKRPPQIIHATIARFREEVDMESIEIILNRVQVELVEGSEGFRLIRETQVPMQAVQLIKIYSWIKK